MNRAYLLIGGNLGNREETLAQARSLIVATCGIINALSSIYETAAWGNSNQPAFLNQALALDTMLAARPLIRCLLKIEKKMGRVRKEKYDPRLIDIDILLFNDEIFNEPLLKVPHPEMPNRRFALLPLVEIAPNLQHPVIKKTITEILTACNDPLAVNKFY